MRPARTDSARRRARRADHAHVVGHGRSHLVKLELGQVGLRPDVEAGFVHDLQLNHLPAGPGAPSSPAPPPGCPRRRTRTCPPWPLRSGPRSPLPGSSTWRPSACAARRETLFRLPWSLLSSASASLRSASIRPSSGNSLWS